MQADATRLMTAAKNGDREAFDRLVESLRGQAYRLAVSLVGSREDAMELSQEAFLKTYRARASFRDGEPFLPWFHRILRNCCYSFLRKRGRLRKASLSARAGQDEDEGDWEIADEGPAPHDAALADERARLFWQAFRTLSARDREVLTLRHFQELSYQEIADTLSIPIGTVMSRLFHARRRLREALGGTLDEDLTPADTVTTPRRPSSR
jgi:RNA polymerase sigma-70 factor (ECF subfamily)